MANTGFNLPSSACCDSNPYHLPSQYRSLKVLGTGSFGCVLRCLKKDTQETVAVKIPIFNDTDQELSMMRRIMIFDLHECNIVKFLDSFNTPSGKALVMEELDISLFDYIIKTQCEPMLLSDIRTIIQQLATAIDALKSIWVIHTDIKLDNIMMVDHQRRPFKVKLIDFGLAIPRNKAQLGMRLQPQHSRAPEIILGLPFSEPIDMWSLANVFASMITGSELFEGETDYEVLQVIIYRLGQPADHLLNNGIYTRKYFIKTKTGNWRLKKPEEYQGPVNPRKRPSGLKDLDVLKNVRLEAQNEVEAFEREQCIELLKAMLRMDAKERITPTGVLTHPFIFEAQETSRSFSSPLLFSSHSHSSGLTRARPAPPSISFSLSQVQVNKTSPTISPSHVIHVKPAPPENTRDLENLESSVSLYSQARETSSSVFWTSESKDPDLSTSDRGFKLKDTPNNQTELNSPSPTIPPSPVILVRPAPPENTWHLENLENSVSLQAELKNTSESSVIVTKTDTTTWTSDDSTSCGKNQSPQSHLPTSDSSPRKTEKNYFQRFFSWMKNFWSCLSCVDDSRVNCVF